MENNDCSCHECQGACRHKPGWFMPGEAEKAAELLGMTLPDFFAAHLGVDWWEEDEGATFVLAPATTQMDAGEEYPGDPKGQCVFFQDGLCTIHAAKPHECRMYIHGEANDSVHARHEAVATAWRTNQEQIEALLGREPEQDSYAGGLLDLFGFFR